MPPQPYPNYRRDRTPLLSLTMRAVPPVPATRRRPEGKQSVAVKADLDATFPGSLPSRSDISFREHRGETILVPNDLCQIVLRHAVTKPTHPRMYECRMRGTNGSGAGSLSAARSACLYSLSNKAASPQLGGKPTPFSAALQVSGKGASAPP